MLKEGRGACENLHLLVVRYVERGKWGDMAETGGNGGCVGEPNGIMVQSWEHPRILCPGEPLFARNEG